MPAPAPHATSRRRCSSDQCGTIRKRVGDDGPGLLGRAFAAERGAHADHHHRERRARERAQRGQATREVRDGLGDVDAVAAREAAHEHLPRAGHRAGCQQNEQVMRRIRLLRGVEQMRSRPACVLNRKQEVCENCRGDAGAEAGQQDRHPEYGGSRTSQGRRDTRKGVTGRVGHGLRLTQKDLRQSLPSRLKKSLPSFQIRMREDSWPSM